MPQKIAMKITAIIGGGTKKDFIDLAFLLDYFSLDEILNFYEKKYQFINVVAGYKLKQQKKTLFSEIFCSALNVGYCENICFGFDCLSIFNNHGNRRIKNAFPATVQW